MRALVVFLGVGVLWGQPVLYDRGALNAASLAPPGLPNAPIARGSIFTVFGANIGPSQGLQVSAFPLTPTFSGVTLSVTQAGVTTQAFPIYVSATQINAVMPSSVTAGLASLRLTYQQAQSNAIPIQIANSAPGVFALSAGGFGPAIVQNYDSSGNPTLNSSTAPAAPGQTIVIWGTGLGPVTFPDNVEPTAGNVSTTVTISIGGVSSPDLYSGRAPCCSGLDQIVTTVPANVPLGCWVPVSINAGGVVSNTATMAIASASATSCSDPGNPLSPMVRTAGSQALIMLSQINDVNNLDASTPVAGLYQQLYSRFANRAASPYSFDPYLSYPPTGACIVHQTSGDASLALTLRGALPASASLNPQPNQTYNNGTQSFTVPTTGALYAGIVGANLPSSQAGLGPPATGATFTVDPNGPNAKTLAVSAEPAPAWTPPPGLLTIPRKVPLTLTFTPADKSAPTSVLIYAYTSAIDSTVEVQCLAAPGAASFTISSDTLANLPATYQLIDGSYARLMIGTLGLNNALTFSNGLAANGILFHANWLSQSVVLQ
jgi:uncharacterized protein (TIGR03437 family)